jgi:hypothetical protein
MAPRWLDPYIVGHYQLEVANDIFNDVELFVPVILSRRPRSAAWHRAVGPPCTVAVTGEWPAALTLHCSHMSSCLAGIVYGAYLHVLQAHNGLDVRRLGYVRMCVRNMRALLHRHAY